VYFLPSIGNMGLKKVLVTYNGKDKDIGYINPDNLSGL